MKHIKLITEMYKPATEFDEVFPGLNVPVRTFVDNVFDHVVQINCDVNHISEKSFKLWDDTRDYIEKMFDNNPEILLDIDMMKGKRCEYVAEFIFDKYFTAKNEIE